MARQLRKAFEEWRWSEWSRVYHQTYDRHDDSKTKDFNDAVREDAQKQKGRAFALSSIEQLINSLEDGPYGVGFGYRHEFWERGFFAVAGLPWYTVQASRSCVATLPRERTL